VRRQLISRVPPVPAGTVKYTWFLLSDYRLSVGLSSGVSSERVSGEMPRVFGLIGFGLLGEWSLNCDGLLFLPLGVALHMVCTSIC